MTFDSIHQSINVRQSHDQKFEQARVYISDDKKTKLYLKLLACAVAVLQVAKATTKDTVS